MPFRIRVYDVPTTNEGKHAIGDFEIKRKTRSTLYRIALWDVSGRYGPETVKQKVWSEAENGEQDRGEVCDTTHAKPILRKNPPVLQSIAT